MSDTILRQAAINTVVFECGEWTGLAKEISKQLRQLPSTEPEKRTNKRTKTHECDLISRQEAIDDLHGKDPSQIWDTADIEVWLNALPSAEPERKTGRWVANRYCSVCDFDKKEFDYIAGWEENFCPKCGAKMEGNA